MESANVLTCQPVPKSGFWNSHHLTRILSAGGASAVRPEAQGFDKPISGFRGDVTRAVDESHDSLTSTHFFSSRFPLVGEKPGCQRPESKPSGGTWVSTFEEKQGVILREIPPTQSIEKLAMNQVACTWFSNVRLNVRTSH
jgi:hypothetical protein